jgi:hypothetical protein
VFGEKPPCYGRGILPPWVCPPWPHDATTGHEPRRRSQGADPTDPAEIIPLCTDGHGWVHDHPAEASRLRAPNGLPFMVLRRSSPPS